MHPRLPPSQHWLLKKMKETNNLYDGRGLCKQVSQMGMEAILRKNTHQFDAHFFKIHETDELGTKIDNLQRSLLSEALLENKLVSDFIPLLPKEEQTLLSTKKFMEEMEASARTDLFFPLITSQKKHIADVGIFSGIYGVPELEKLLSSLRNSIEMTQTDAPISFELESSEHTIVISYDYQKKAWIFIDANELPTQLIGSNEAMALKIARAFDDKSEQPIVAFSTRINANKSELEKVQPCMDLWQQTSEYKSIHSPTEEKARLIDTTDGKTSWLWVASKVNDLRAVNQLLEKGANPNQLGIKNTTPLYMAVQNCHVDIIKILLAHPDINPDLANYDNGATPLLLATSIGHEGIIRLLLNKGADPSLPDFNGITPLYEAIAKGDLNIISLLLTNENTDPNAATRDGTTPLYLAVLNGRDDIVEALFENPETDANCSLEGITALHIAVEKNQSQIVNILLKNDATPNDIRNDNGRTALITAIHNKRLDIVKLLLENEETDPNLPSAKEKIRPLELAKMTEQREIVDILSSQKKIEKERNPDEKWRQKKRSLFDSGLSKEDLTQIKGDPLSKKPRY